MSKKREKNKIKINKLTKLDTRIKRIKIKIKKIRVKEDVIRERRRTRKRRK